MSFWTPVENPGTRPPRSRAALAQWPVRGALFRFPSAIALYGRD